MLKKTTQHQAVRRVAMLPLFYLLYPSVAPRAVRGDDTYIKCQEIERAEWKQTKKATAEDVLSYGSAKIYDCRPRGLKTWLHRVYTLLPVAFFAPFTFFQFQFHTRIWNMNLFPRCWSEFFFFPPDCWLCPALIDQLVSGVAVLPVEVLWNTYVLCGHSGRTTLFKLPPFFLSQHSWRWQSNKLGVSGDYDF